MPADTESWVRMMIKLGREPHEDCYFREFLGHLTSEHDDDKASDEVINNPDYAQICNENL